MKQIDELIRGELSAVKSIDAILEKVKDAREKSELSLIRRDHVKAVELLKLHGSSEGVDEVETAGPWGSFASAFTGGASFFGDKAALNALKVGEQHGFNEYKEALEDETMNPKLRGVIETQLIPQQQRHLSMIDRYIQ